MRNSLMLFILPILALQLAIIADQEKETHNIFTQENQVDSLLNSMTLDEKIGQVFMIPVSPRDEGNYQQTKDAIEKYKVGGLIFMHGHPKKQVNWLNAFQEMSSIPLLISMDAEWGPSMRLDSVIRYPKQMTLGAMNSDFLVYQYGRTMGKQLKRLGVNVSFSPVADVNSNPDNPVINIRSFGDDRENVARKCIMYARGLQREGVLAVAKHFPGHGDTYVDSHKDLPTIERSKKEMDSVDIYPFKKAFDAGCGGVMSAHIQVPAYDKTKKQPASLSPKITTTLLRETLGFNGLCFSDALSMGGVTNYYKSNEIDIKALKAGNDVLLFPQNIPAAINAIKAAIADGSFSEELLNQKVRRILQVKQWAGKTDTKPSTDSLYEELNKPAYQRLNYDIAENSICLIHNESNFLPLANQKEKLFSLAFYAKNNVFEEALNQYYPTEGIIVNEKESVDGLLEQIQNTSNGTIVISLHWLNAYAVKSNYGIYSKHLALIEELSKTRNVVLVNFGTPYALKLFSKPKAVIQAFESIDAFNIVAAQVIAGAHQPIGVLPCNLPGTYPAGTSITFERLNKLKTGMPEQVGLNTEQLYQIDSIAKRAILAEATPGCQVLIAKNNRVIYYKSFGKFTYDEQATPVKNTDFYDVASLTKIMASTMLLMKLYDQGKIDLDQTLGFYLKDAVSEDKADLSLREILAHQSGLEAWIPFYNKTLTEEGLCDSNYCYAPNGFFSLQVADSLFINPYVADTIMDVINKSELKDRGEYRYSDLGYFYLKQIIEKLYNANFEDVLYSEFYKPMGLSATYNPMMSIDKSQIVPTEMDQVFRKKLIHGYVHDPAAAMMGGIAGHAGVFSNAWDVAVLMQMLLNNGVYGDKRYLSSNTISTFTAKQYKGNRKGLGFDKPEMDSTKGTPSIRDMSAKGFGHQGFTGTCVWTDPEYNLTYVFLSNRVYPSAENKKLASMNVRTDILQVIYDNMLHK